MATEYTDIKILECNRLHSEEAKAGNDENFALWQNNLQDIVHLEAGDKVSLHGAMVSERGAGQTSSIEIKGDSIPAATGISCVHRVETTLKPAQKPPYIWLYPVIDGRMVDSVLFDSHNWHHLNGIASD